MKIIGIDDEEEIKKKVLNNKKVLATAIGGVLAVIFIILFCFYMGNRGFREFIDKYIFMKNVTENNLVSISLDESETNYVYTYDKYISVLNQNKLVGYNKQGNKEYELNLEISNPIADSNSRFLLIGENTGKKLYLISGNNMVWENEVEGSISRVSVNKNGYVSVILTGTTYQSIIQIFDNNGKELFKTYLNSIAVDSDISGDNKYLSFAEVSTNGTLAQTTIETISIPKAKEQTTSSQSIVSKFVAQNDKVPLNLKYQDGDRLICMYNNSIDLIKNDTSEELMSFEEDGKKITYGGAELSNYIFRIIEKNNLLSSETTVEIMNSGNKNVNMYVMDGTIKEASCNDSIIALNLGTEVHFIGTNGWLIKKYISHQEVRKIIINSGFAGIVYRDKVEIVDL